MLLSEKKIWFSARLISTFFERNQIWTRNNLVRMICIRFKFVLLSLTLDCCCREFVCFPQKNQWYNIVFNFKQKNSLKFGNGAAPTKNFRYLNQKHKKNVLWEKNVYLFILAPHNAHTINPRKIEENRNDPYRVASETAIRNPHQTERFYAVSWCIATLSISVHNRLDSMICLDWLHRRRLSHKVDTARSIQSVKVDSLRCKPKTENWNQFTSSLEHIMFIEWGSLLLCIVCAFFWLKILWVWCTGVY